MALTDLSFLSAFQRRLYDAGLLSDTDLNQIKKEQGATRYVDPANVVAGPPTLDEEMYGPARAQGFIDAGAGDSGVAGGVAGGFAQGISQAARTLYDLGRAQENPVANTLAAVPGMGGLAEYIRATGIGKPQVSPEEEARLQHEARLRQAEAEGASTARNMGVEDSNWLSRKLVEHGAGAGNVLSLAAGLAFSRGRLAVPMIGAAMTVPTTTSAGGAAQEALAEGLSAEDAFDRARGTAAIEAGTEAILPGAGKALGFGRNFLKNLGTEIATEQTSLLGTTALDLAAYRELAPADIDEFKKQAVSTLEGTLLYGGPVSAIGAKSQSNQNKALRAEGLRRAMQDVKAVTGGTGDLDIARGIDIADKIEKQVQLDMFGTPEGLPSVEEYEAGRRKDLELDALQQVGRRKFEAETLDEMSRRRVLSNQQEVNENQANLEGRSTLGGQLSPEQLAPLSRLPSSPSTTPATTTPTQGEMFSLEAPEKPLTKEQLLVQDFRKKEEERAKATAAKQDTARAAAVQKAMRDATTANPNISDDELAKIAIVSAKKYDADLSAKQTKAREQAARRVGVPVQEAKTAAPATPRMTAADLKKSGVASIPGNEGKGLAEQEFINTLLTDEKVKTNLSKAIISGKVKVVDDTTAPKEALEANAGGWFDGKNLYLNRNKLSKEDLSAVALHEVKHYFDTETGSQSRSFRSILGDEANERTISKIEKAAKSGNKIAVKALDRYKNAEEVAGPQGRDEIVTYFVEEAQKARDSRGALGSVRSIVDDVVGASKTFLRDKGGAPFDVSLGDLAYMSRELMGKYATQETRSGTQSAPKFSVIGRGGAKFDSYKKFTDPVDNQQKAEIDSSKMSLSDDFREALEAEGRAPVGDLVAYDELYANYPDMPENLIITVSDDPEDAGAYNPADGTISISREDLSNPERVRSTLLHEIQHAIQHKEGFDFGTAIEEALSGPARKVYEDSLTSMQYIEKNQSQRVTPSVREAGGVRSSNPRIALRLIGDKYVSGALSAQAKTVIDSDPVLRKYMQHYTKYKPLYDVAYDNYQRTSGEAEARTVEARRNYTQEARDRISFLEDKNRIKGVEGKPLVRSKNVPDKKTVKFSVAEDIDLTHSSPNAFGTSRQTPYLLRQGKRGPIVISPDSNRAKMLDLIKKGFGNTGVPDEVLATADRAFGANAEVQLEALNRINRVSKEISNLADPDAAYKMLQDYENSETREERLAKAPAFKKKYPQVFEAYNDARFAVASYSEKIANEMEKLGVTLTDKQRAVIESIRDNISNYMTRSYAAFGPKKIAKAHQDYLYTTPEGKEVLRKVKEWAVDNVVSIPENLNKMERDRLEALYDMWVPAEAKQDSDNPGAIKDSSELSKEELVETLEQFRDQPTMKLLDKQADQFVMDLLATGIRIKQISKMAKFYRGERQDLTIVTPKNNVPSVIRELWGEQTDPLMNVFTTMIRQGEMLTRIQEQWKMANEMTGTVFFDKATDGPAGAKLEKLTGESFGPLRGKFTTREVKAFLDSREESVATFSGWLDTAREVMANKNVKNAVMLVSETANLLGRWAGIAGGKIKYANVVLNPINFLLNAGGAPLQMIANGNVTFKNAAKGAKVAFRDMPGAAYKTMSTDEIKELVRNGVLDSAFVGEIQDAELNSLIDRFLRKGPAGKAPVVAQGKSMITDYYSATDLYAKIANYYTEKEWVESFYKKAGVEMSEDDIQRIAADRIKQTNFSFRHAWAPAKALERSGITNFLTYNAETVRTIYGNARLGIGDVITGIQLKKSNPELGSMVISKGMKRLAGVTVATSGHTAMLAALGKAISLMTGIEEDEDEDTIKKGLPVWNANRILQLAGIDPDGTRKYFDLGRIDPYGPLNEGIRATFDAISTGDTTKLQQFASNTIMLNQVLDVLLQNVTLPFTEGPIRKQRNPAGATISPDAYEALAENLADYMPGINEGGEGARMSAKTAIQLLESVAPAIVDNAFWAITNYKTVDPVPNVLAGLGLKPVKYNPRSDVPKGVRAEYIDKVNTLRDTWSNYLRVQRNVTPEDISKKFNELASEEYDTWKKGREKVEAALAAGVPKRQIQTALKDAEVGNAVQIASLLSGKFTPTSVSTDTLDGNKQYEIKDAETKKRKEKIKEIKNKYNVVERTVPRLLRNYKPREED